MFGANFETSELRWMKATEIESIDTASIHGHIFVLTEDGLCAYELQEGPLPDLLSENNLTSLIGLQVLGCCDGSMSELILDHGTVMLESSVVKNILPARITGWSFESVNGTPRGCQANETHSAMTSGNHKVFNAGKPHPKLKNVEDLKAALDEAGIL
ncbi:hypothetical protein F4782DRAFT_526391 [Xylaria castorea]|nr:hypothetical protein F4782DRAFT_526391 [Xylaria castorea]